MSAIMLSEAVFVPLMLAGLWGLAVLWVEPGRSIGSRDRRRRWCRTRERGAAGLAILVRPSWAIFVPVVLLHLG